MVMIKKSQAFKSSCIINVHRSHSLQLLSFHPFIKSVYKTFLIDIHISFHSNKEKCGRAKQGVKYLNFIHPSTPLLLTICLIWASSYEIFNKNL